MLAGLMTVSAPARRSFATFSRWVAAGDDVDVVSRSETYRRLDARSRAPETQSS